MALYWTSEENKHKHLVYLPENGLDAPTSTAKARNHVHEVTPDVTGPVFMPAKDGHTHILAEAYAAPEPKTTEKDEEQEKKEEETLCKEVLDMYFKAKEDEKECRKKGEESYDFRHGKPWKDEDVTRLDSESRAHLAVDEVGAMVELLLGYQQQNRSDIFYRPTEPGDSEVAEAANILTKNILDNNNYEYEESQTFEDMLVPGRGFFAAYVDYETNPQGDIRVEHVRWDKPFLGPHEKLTAADLEVLTLTDEFSKAKIDRMFPDKAEKIQKWFDDFSGSAAYSESVVPAPGMAYKAPQSAEKKEGVSLIKYGDEAIANITTKEIKVFERWMKEYYSEPIAVFGDGISMPIEGKDMTAIKTLPEAKVINVAKYRMRVTRIAGMVLLSDDYVDDNDFPYIVAYAHKYKEVWVGKVERLKDAAREIDKRRSQLADYLNASVGTLYITEDSMDKADEKTFRANAHNPLHITKLKTFDAIPRRGEPVKVPVEFLQEDRLSSDKLKDIANMRDVAGIAPNMSGRALMVQRRTSLTGNNYLFDNLNLAKKLLGRRLLKLIRKAYTLERAKRIIVSTQSAQTPEDVKPISDEAIMKLLSEDRLDALDVVVDESPQSKTMTELSFQMLAELRSQGVPDIDTMTLIDTSPLAFSLKQKIKQGVMAARQQAAQIEDRKQMSEIEKSLPDEAKMALVNQRNQQSLGGI